MDSIQSTPSLVKSFYRPIIANPALSPDAPVFYPSSIYKPEESTEVKLRLTRSVLEKLSTYERRAREETPLKYAKLQRLVFGAKEITRELEKFQLLPNRPFPIKFLVIANNLTDAAFLSEIAVIKNVCMSNKIPVISDILSKNQIGKITGKPIRQAIVAVINPEGARDEIARIAELTLIHS